MQTKNSNPPKFFYYCFFHVFSVKHTNYHHVIFHLTGAEMDEIKSLDAETYQYSLISAQPVFLDETEQATLVIRGLIMDGESLLKRFKAQQKKENHSTFN